MIESSHTMITAQAMTAKAATPVTRRGRKRLSLCPPPEEIFAEGVFFQLNRVGTLSSQHSDLDKKGNPKNLKHSATSTESTSCSTSSTCCCTPPCSPPNSWRSTDRPSFILHQPLMVSNPDQNVESERVENEAEQLGKVMQRCRNLPGTWYYSSNHVMVNQERTRRVIAPLTRLAELDAMAREHAAAMATQSKLFHSDPVELHAKFNQHHRFSRRMGENVACGPNIREIHKEMMKIPTDKHNILHRRYTHFGMGTAKGQDGKLYLCQVFRG